jgi:hypothetical protein
MRIWFPQPVTPSLVSPEWVRKNGASKCWNSSFSENRGRSSVFAGASWWSLLVEEGRGVLDDPQGPLSRARDRDRRRKTRASRGNRRNDHGRSHRGGKVQAAERQSDFGLGGRARLRRRRAEKQLVLTGVAAEVGEADGVSRSRSGRLVLAHRGCGKNHERAASHPDEAGYRARPRCSRGAEDILPADKPSRFAYLSREPARGRRRRSARNPLTRLTAVELTNSRSVRRLVADRKWADRDRGANHIPR